MCRVWDSVLCHGMCCIGREPTTNKAYSNDFTADLEVLVDRASQTPRLRHPRALGLVGGGALDAISRELLLQEDVKACRHLRRRLVVEDEHHVRVEVAARLWRAERRRVDAVAARRLLERSQRRSVTPKIVASALEKVDGPWKWRFEMAKWPTTPHGGRLCITNEAVLPQHAGGGARRSCRRLETRISERRAVGRQRGELLYFARRRRGAPSPGLGGIRGRCGGLQHPP